MEMNVGREVAALQRMTVKQLRHKYTEVFGEDTNGHNKAWLVKRIARQRVGSWFGIWIDCPVGRRVRFRRFQRRRLVAKRPGGIVLGCGQRRTVRQWRGDGNWRRLAI
jgi:hypothetical protein